MRIPPLRAILRFGDALLVNLRNLVLITINVNSWYEYLNHAHLTRSVTLPAAVPLVSPSLRGNHEPRSRNPAGSPRSCLRAPVRRSYVSHCWLRRRVGYLTCKFASYSRHPNRSQCPGAVVGHRAIDVWRDWRPNRDEPLAERDERHRSEVQRRSHPRCAGHVY